VEARTLADVQTALDLGVERILLDNMTTKMMTEAIRMRDAFARATYRSPLLEASGNVTLESVRRIAETGVDFISVGALTHSAKVFDVSFDYLPV
jgi:nicotinate-nucleotide pyrophosphorylase (carboxylating)